VCCSLQNDVAGRVLSRQGVQVEPALEAPEPLQLHEPHGNRVVRTVKRTLGRVLLLARAGALERAKAKAEAHVDERLHREPVEQAKEVERGHLGAALGVEVEHECARVQAHGGGHGLAQRSDHSGRDLALPCSLAVVDRTDAQAEEVVEDGALEVALGEILEVRLQHRLDVARSRHNRDVRQSVGAEGEWAPGLRCTTSSIQSCSRGVFQRRPTVLIRRPTTCGSGSHRGVGSIASGRASAPGGLGGLVHPPWSPSDAWSATTRL
jgi:hypothetical protein